MFAEEAVLDVLLRAAESSLLQPLRPEEHSSKSGTVPQVICDCMKLQFKLWAKEAEHHSRCGRGWVGVGLWVGVGVGVGVGGGGGLVQ